MGENVGKPNVMNNLKKGNSIIHDLEGSVIFNKHKNNLCLLLFFPIFIKMCERNKQYDQP